MTKDNKLIHDAQGNNTVEFAPPPPPPAPLSATSSQKPLPTHIRKNSLAKAASSNSLKRNNSAIIVIDDSEDENEDPAQSSAKKNGQGSSSLAAVLKNRVVHSSPGKGSASTSLRQLEANESQERESKKRRYSENQASSLLKGSVKEEEKDDDTPMQIDSSEPTSRTNSALGRAGPSRSALLNSKAKEESDDEEMKPLARTTSSRSNDKASTSTSTSNDSDWITLPSIKRQTSPILLEDSDGEDVKPSLAVLKSKKPLPKAKLEEDEDEASQPAFAAVAKSITPRQYQKLEADYVSKHKEYKRYSDENRQARQRLRQTSGSFDTWELEDEISRRDADMRELENEMKAIERDLQSQVVKDEAMDEEVDELMSEKEDIKPKVKDDSDTEMLPDLKTSFVTKPKLVKQTSLNRHWGNVGGVPGPSSERSSSASASSRPKPKFEEDSDDDDKKDVKPKIDDDDEADAIMRDLAEAGKNLVMGYDPHAGAADDEDLEGVDPHLKDFLRSSKHMQDFESETSVEDALAVLGLNSLTDKLKDTNIQLYAHQVLGVKWALAQEAHKKYKGGIIADEMGLGKTVQMISIISQNQSDDPKEKSTLILAPLGKDMTLALLRAQG
jgi:SNF2 family DNA or RNA helicase